MVRVLLRLALAGLGTVMSACGPAPTTVGPPPDAPSVQVVTPAPGLRLTASLDHSRVTSAGSVVLRVDLKNEGATQLQLPGGDPCNPALQVAMWDAGGQVVWSEPARMCAVRGDSVTPLPPGGSLTGSQCYNLSTGSQAIAPPKATCTPVALKPGTYQVGGAFYGKSVPRLELTLI